ncbi:MAG: hypothetical protein MZU84_05180 [Sphingobacterium sp.]|nr:hypothetical protein [Sphingobacterium sp.]
MTEGYLKRIELAARAIHDAEKLVIGAGAGLSATTRIKYDGDRFVENFRPFIEKYGMKDLLPAFIQPEAGKEMGIQAEDMSSFKTV